MIEVDEKKFKQCLNVIAASPEGQIVIAHLKHVLGWDDIFMSLENTNHANVYYQARRGVYGWLRTYINPENLKQIEFNHRKKEVKNDGSGGKSRTRKRISI